MKRNKKTIDLDPSALDALKELKEKKNVDPEVAAALKAIDIVSNVMESISKGSQIDLAYFSYYSKNMKKFLSRKKVNHGLRMQKKEDGNK